jgi:hypothetical protein
VSLWGQLILYLKLIYLAKYLIDSIFSIEYIMSKNEYGTLIDKMEKTGS